MSNVINLADARSRREAPALCGDALEQIRPSPLSATALEVLARAIPPKPTRRFEGNERFATRSIRREVWQRAECILTFYRGLCDAANISRCLWEEFRVEDAQIIYERWGNYEAVALMRQASADLLLAPAPTVSCLVRKRRMAISDQAEYWPIHRGDVERAIAEDEAWLAAHARTEHGTRRDQT